MNRIWVLVIQTVPWKQSCYKKPTLSQNHRAQTTDIINIPMSSGCFFFFVGAHWSFTYKKKKKTFLRNRPGGSAKTSQNKVIVQSGALWDILCVVWLNDNEWRDWDWQTEDVVQIMTCKKVIESIRLLVDFLRVFELLKIKIFSIKIALVYISAEILDMKI